jgi:hypothetical protein
VVVLVLSLTACGKPVAQAAHHVPPPEPSVETSAPPSVAPSPSAAPSSPKPSRKPSPRPSTTLKKTVPAGGDTRAGAPSPAGDGVPTHGAGTFAVAGGGAGVLGTGATLVKYRVEIENGIDWGTNPVWTADSFAATVDGIVPAERGWTRSAQSPVTDPDEQMTNASWSFQRVSGTDYSVRIRLATPDTVDKQCGAVGVQTQGVYSCRFGQTIMINLRRWLRGAPNFPVDLATYRANVVNHEMGHFLGFDHMRCPGAGTPAPIMQTQTIALDGCTPNSYPFTADGTFIVGPWAPS